jgi:hypothetical protein
MTAFIFSNRKRILLTFAALTSIFLLLNTLEFILHSNLKSLLKRYGFEHATIGSVELHGGEALFENIQLDPEKFSTLGVVRARFHLFPLLTGKGFESFTVKDLALNGITEGYKKPTIDGWNGAIPLPFFPASLNLEGGKLDLDTPQGAIRLEAKGQTTPTPEGTKLQAALWGTQYQLKLDTRWSGLMKSGGGWSLDGDIREARVNLDAIKTSRVSGWLSLAKDSAPTAPVSIGGQVNLGGVTFNGLSLSNVALTLDGTSADLHVFGGGEIAGFNNLRAAFDVKFSVLDGASLNISVETPKRETMIGFLTALRKPFENEPMGINLTSFLLTPGNLDRLSAEIAKAPYDMLELNITGDLADLGGSLTAVKSRDNVVSRTVISLDPAGR